MRLKLTISRHCLPPIRLLWVVPQDAGSSVTVSQFLENVNDVVQLEGDDWGLEDYAVEVQGFECLHYSDIHNVLQEEDEVSVRPLQSSDMRARKVSGRHQITEDGKHLIDGVPFGRALLRRASRPAIQIPPRKRRRLLQRELETDLDEDQVEDRQVALLSAGPHAHDQSVSSDEDDERSDDFDESTSAGAESLTEELRALQNDSMSQHDLHSPKGWTPEADTTSSAGPHGLGLIQVSPTSSQGSHGRSTYAPFRECSNAGTEKVIRKSGINRGPKELPAANRRDASNRVARNQLTSTEQKSPRESLGSGKNVRFEESSPGTPVTVRQSESSAEEDEDSDFAPDDEDQSNKENAPPSDNQDSDSSISTSDSDDDTSSSGSSSVSESNSGPDKLSTQSLPTSLESGLASVSDSHSTSTSSSPSVKHASQNTNPKQQQPAKAPGTGLRRTRERNKRKTKRKQLEKLLKAAWVASADTATNPENRVEPSNSLHEDPKVVDGQLSSLDRPDSQGSSALHQDSSVTLNRVQHESPVVQVKDSLPRSQTGTPSRPHSERPNANEKAVVNNSAKTEGASPSVGGRRAKLDLESSKRLLFGSLGLNKSRLEHNKGISQGPVEQTSKPANRDQSKDVVEESFPASEIIEDDESWKEKIVLQAVECCHEGVEYSAPPFPFIQRWDPQQRRGPGNQQSKRKQKKRKRNNAIYYEDQYDDSFNDGLENKSPRRENYTPAATEAYFDVLPGSMGGVEDLDHSVPEAASQQLIRESLSAGLEVQAMGEDNDDLPPLPSDLSTYPVLDATACRPGAMIAFKKFEMGVGDQWHPYISEHRLAKVDMIHPNGLVDLTYSKRDTPKSTRQFDPDTGERLYGKFEMPGFDEEDGDPSKISIDFAELIEPVLISQSDRIDVEAKPQEQQTNVKISQSQAEAISGIPGEQDNGLESKSYHDLQQLAEQSALGDNVNSNERLDQQMAFSNTQTGHDFSQVFREAGWRSSIGSDIRRQLELQDKDEVAQTQNAHDDALKDHVPSSPKFNGFSSPLQRNRSVSSSTASPPELSYLDSQIAESVPHESEDLTSGMKTDTSVGYPVLPQMDEKGDLPSSQNPHRSSPLKTSSVSAPEAISPPATRRQRPLERSPAAIARDANRGSKGFTFFDGGHGSESDELPTLFSQKFEQRLSEEVILKRDTSQEPSAPTTRSKSKTSSATKRTKPSSQGTDKPAQRGVKQVNRKTSSDAQKGVGLDNGDGAIDDDVAMNCGADDDNGDEFDALSLPSQQPLESASLPNMTQESVMVDLTMSSDPPEKQGMSLEADESFRYPSSSARSSAMPDGSGWVKKGRKSRRGDH